MRAFFVVGLLCLVTLAGCFGKDAPKEPEAVVPDPVYEPPEPEPGIQMPPCALQAGDIEWPDWPTATPPSGPVEVTIKRDAYDVPHIYADDLYSLMYGNGYAQAQDRLFELDLLRHVGWGDAAAVVGAAQLGSDVEVHRELYSAEEIEAQWQAASPAAKSILQAYSDGVNRYMLEATARNELPGEFAALGHVPEPWTPQDSVASIIYLIGYFGVDGGHELGNLQRLAQLNDTLGPDQAWTAFQDLSWLRIDDSPTTIHPDDRIINGCEDGLPREQTLHQWNLDAARGAVILGVSEGTPGLPDPAYAQSGERKGSGVFEGFHWGSNALLVDGSHTDTGRPIMWGAPQMGYYKPPVPYQVGLHGAGFDATGIGVATAPGIVIGRNADLAWSATSGIEDMTDIVELRLDGARSYLWDGETRAMDCHVIQHSTAPAPADLAAFPDVAPPMTYEQEVCRADGMPVVAINEDAGVAWAKRITTRGEELLGAFIWLGLAQSDSIDDFRDRVADFPFTFNFHVAGMDSVAYIHTGDIPLRADGFDPRLPTPSGDAYAWRGEAYTGEMDVWAEDPSSGYFANWNNGPAFGWRAGDQRGLWGPVHRVHAEIRTVDAALASGPLDHGDVEAANWASARTDSLAGPFMPFLIQAAEDAGSDEAAQALRDWQAAGLPWRDGDGDGRYDDLAHAIWDRMYAEILELQRDELGEFVHALQLDPRLAGDPHAGDHGEHNNPLATMYKAIAGRSQHDWCRSDTAETCREALAAAMERVVADMPDLEPVHMSGFTAMGAFNADERPMINRGSWVQVVAMGEGLEGASSALPPSNSGRINNPETALWVGTGIEPAHLTMELDMYWSGEYKPMPLAPDEVDAVAVSTETLIVLP